MMGCGTWVCLGGGWVQRDVGGVVAWCRSAARVGGGRDCSKGFRRDLFAAEGAESRATEVAKCAAPLGVGWCSHLAPGSEEWAAVCGASFYWVVELWRAGAKRSA